MRLHPLRTATGLFSLFSFFTLLAGCSLTRPPVQAEAAAPAQWHSSLPPAPPGAPLPLARWWHESGDPLLAELVDAALSASPDTASAAARMAEARAARTAAGAALAPALDASLSASRGQALAGAAVGNATPSPILTTLQAGLQASWEIDLFGNRRAQRDAASARLDASQAQWHGARVAVVAETASTYFAERACARQWHVAQADSRSRAETARLSALSAQAGFTAPADAALVQAGASDAASRLAQQRAQCTLLRHSLVALTGWEAAALAQRLDARLVEDFRPAALPQVARVPAQALAQRPDIYAAELAVAAASADTGAAQAQRYPRLTLLGNIGRTQLRSGDWHPTLETWSIGPLALTLPLFDGGARAAQVDAAQARYGEAVAQYRARVRLAVREVEEALTQLHSSDERGGDADSAVLNYQRAFDATQARHQAGLASLFELEDARRALFAAQSARVALQRERATAWIALYRAVGGGWTRPDQLTSSHP